MLSLGGSERARFLVGAPGRRRCKRNRRAAELRGAACSPAGALAAQLPAPSSEQLLLLLLLSLFFLLPCLVAPPCNFELLVRAVLVPWGRGEQKSNKRRRPALRKIGHEEGVFHEENELQKQEENGLVLVWAALCCGPQITKGNWSQAAGTCRWSQARTWAPLGLLGLFARSFGPPERPWPLWRRPCLDRTCRRLPAKKAAEVLALSTCGPKRQKKKLTRGRFSLATLRNN